MFHGLRIENSFSSGNKVWHISVVGEIFWYNLIQVSPLNCQMEFLTHSKVGFSFFLLQGLGFVKLSEEGEGRRGGGGKGRKEVRLLRIPENRA